MPLFTSSNTDMSGSTFEELMLSRGSMTGILSRDLFSGDTLAGSGAANAGIRFLGLVLRASGAQRDCVSQERRRDMQRLRRTCLIHDGALIFVLIQLGICAASHQALRIALAFFARQGLLR